MFTILALLLMFSCENVSFMDSDSEGYVQFRSIDDGTVLLPGNDLVFDIKQEESAPKLTLMEMSLADADGQLLFEEPLENPVLDEYRIKTENLHNGNYLLQLDFSFENGSTFSKIVDFYYYQNKVEIDGIKSFPSHFQPYSQGLLQLQIANLSDDMYLVWSIDDDVISEGYGLRKVSWKTPAESGIYDVVVDVYSNANYKGKIPLTHYEGRILVDDAVVFPHWARDYSFVNMYPFQGNVLRDDEAPNFFSKDIEADIYQSGDITGMYLHKDLDIRLGGQNIPVDSIQYVWRMLLPDLSADIELVRFNDTGLSIVYSEEFGLQLETFEGIFDVEFELGNAPRIYTLRVDNYGSDGGFIFLYVDGELIFSRNIQIVPDFQLMDNVSIGDGFVMGGFGRLEFKSYEQKMMDEFGSDLVLAASFADNSFVKENDKLEQMYRKLVILPGGIAEIPGIDLFGSEFTIKLFFDGHLPDDIEFESTITAQDGEYILTLYSSAADYYDRFEYVISRTDVGIVISPADSASIDTGLTGELSSLMQRVRNNSKTPVALKNLLIYKSHTNLINSLL